MKQERDYVKTVKTDLMQRDAKLLRQEKELNQYKQEMSVKIEKMSVEMTERIKKKYQKQKEEQSKKDKKEMEQMRAERTKEKDRIEKREHELLTTEASLLKQKIELKELLNSMENKEEQFRQLQKEQDQDLTLKQKKLKTAQRHLKEKQDEFQNRQLSKENSHKIQLQEVLHKQSLLNQSQAQLAEKENLLKQSTAQLESVSSTLESEKRMMKGRLLNFEQVGMQLEQMKERLINKEEEANLLLSERDKAKEARRLCELELLGAEQDRSRLKTEKRNLELQYSELQEKEKILHEKGTFINSSVSEARRRLQLEEQSLRQREEENQLSLKRERQKIDEERVKSRALLSTMRTEHVNTMLREGEQCRQKERALRQREVEMKETVLKSVSAGMIEREELLGKKEEMVETQLHELREWEASLLYPTQGTTQGREQSQSTTALGSGSSVSAHEKYVVLLTQHQQITQELALLKSTRKSGRSSNNSALDLIEEHEEHKDDQVKTKMNVKVKVKVDDTTAASSSSLSSIVLREQKMNAWSVILQEQQNQCDEDATEIAKEYTTLEDMKQKLREKEQLLKRREDSLVNQIQSQNQNQMYDTPYNPGTTKKQTKRTRMIDHLVVNPPYSSKKEDTQDDGAEVGADQAEALLTVSLTAFRALRTLREEGRRQIHRYQNITTNNTNGNTYSQQLQRREDDLAHMLTRLQEEEEEEERMLLSIGIAVDGTGGSKFVLGTGGSKLDRVLGMQSVTKNMHRRHTLWEEELSRIFNQEHAHGGSGDGSTSMMSTRKSPNRSIHHRSMNRSVNRSLNRSVNRSMNRSLNRSVNRSVNGVYAEDEVLRMEEEDLVLNRAVSRREKLMSSSSGTTMVKKKKKKQGSSGGSLNRSTPRRRGTSPSRKSTSSSLISSSSSSSSSSSFVPKSGKKKRSKNKSGKNSKPVNTVDTDTVGHESTTKDWGVKPTKQQRNRNIVASKDEQEEEREMIVFQDGGGYDTSHSSVVLHRSEGGNSQQHRQQLLGVQHGSSIGSSRSRQHEYDCESEEEDNMNMAQEENDDWAGALGFGDNDPRLSPTNSILPSSVPSRLDYVKDLGNPDPSNDVLSLNNDRERTTERMERAERTESSLPSRMASVATGLTNDLGLSDVSAISHHMDDSLDIGDDLDVDVGGGGDGGGRGGHIDRRKLLLEEQQELRVNLLLVGMDDVVERERLQNRLLWTQEEIQKTE